MKVVVTGVSGFIGGQIMLALRDADHDVMGIDFNGLPHVLKSVPNTFYQTGFSSSDGIAAMQKYQPDVIVHCAGTSLVGPSMRNPGLYYSNNATNTLELMKEIIGTMPGTRVIFSSSAAVYGEPVITPCSEVDPPMPVSPYGESKHMVEQMLAAYNHAYGLDYVAFRYFNVCGADSQGRHGQTPTATHIIARVLSAAKNNTEFVCNGNTYETPDGTCVRDYIHVEDIAQATLLALDSKIKSGIYNLSNGTGASNLDIIQLARTVTGCEIPVKFGPARSGDPALLTGDSTKFREAAGWAPRFTMTDSIEHAWRWRNV